MVFLRWGRQCLRMRALPTTSWPSWMSITSLSSSGGSLAILEMTSTNSSGWWEMSMLCSAKMLLSAYSVSFDLLLLLIFRCVSRRVSTHRTSRSRTTSLRGGSSGWTAREVPPCSTASCTNSPTTGTVREQLSHFKLRIDCYALSNSLDLGSWKWTTAVLQATTGPGMLWLDTRCLKNPWAQNNALNSYSLCTCNENT